MMKEFLVHVTVWCKHPVTGNVYEQVVSVTKSAESDNDAIMDAMDDDPASVLPEAFEIKSAEAWEQIPE